MSVLSSSYALTASYALNSTATIATGSFATTGSNQFKANQFVTGSVTATSFTGSLRGHVVTSSIDTTLYELYGASGQRTILWNDHQLAYDNTLSVHWANRRAYDGAAAASIDWDGRALYDNSPAISVDWANRQLNDSSNSTIVDYSIPRKFTVTGAVTTTLGNVFHSALNDTESFWSGEIDQYNTNTNKLGQLTYLDSTGEWQKIDQTTNTSANYLGISLGETRVLTEGYIRMADVADPYEFTPIQIDNPIVGRPVYIIEGGDGAETNSYSCTLPSSGYVRVLGYVVSRGDSLVNSYMVKFKPSNDWYEI
jgi:hypothetical protein